VIGLAVWRVIPSEKPLVCFVEQLLGDYRVVQSFDDQPFLTGFEAFDVLLTLPLGAYMRALIPYYLSGIYRIADYLADTGAVELLAAPRAVSGGVEYIRDRLTSFPFGVKVKY
jgi:hypothetical protein